MARTPTTESAWRAKVKTQHVPSMEAAMRSLGKPDNDGEHAEAARVIEAGGCYIRRGLAKGYTL